MYEGVTITFVLINTNKEARETIPKMGDIYKKCILKTKKESKYNPTKKFALFKIEEIMEPIMKTFQDKKGRECISIIIGYQINYDPVRFDGLANSFFNDVIKSLLTSLKMDQWNVMIKYSLYTVGHCQNHSYILSSIDPDLSFDPNDEYKWLLIELNSRIDSKAMYNVFPKENITLPSRRI